MKSDKLLTISIILISVLGLVSCSIPGLKDPDTINTSTIFAMDTVMELQIAGDEELLSDSEQIIRDLEKKFSVTDEESEISKLNTEKYAPLSDDTYELLKQALDICQKTDGALNISIYPLLKEWGFTTGEYQVPSDDVIKKLLQYTDFSQIKTGLEADTDSNSQSQANDLQMYARMPDTMEIDLGSVAKGYTSKTVAAYLKEKGVTSGLLNLGGNVECIGSKTNGQPWNVAVKSPYPDSESGYIGVLKASDEVIITSGGYERYFEENGQTYWHILDPQSGKPAKSGLISVTIIGKDGCLCDGLSTALFVKGLEGAISYWKRSEDSFDMILITDDGKIYITEQIADRFSLSAEYYDMETCIIQRGY